MAKIRIKGDTSGYVDLQAPAVAGAGSITVPNLSGTLLTSASDSSDFPGAILTSTSNITSNNGASFLVVRQIGAQQVSGGVETKVLFDTARFDVGSDYDLTNNYFKPTIAGYYSLTFTFLQASGGASYVQNKFYKNGSVYSQPLNSAVSWGQSTTLMYLNGSTDYAEIYIKWSNTQNIYNDATEARGTHFMGHLVRAA